MIDFEASVSERFDVGLTELGRLCLEKGSHTPDDSGRAQYYTSLVNQMRPMDDDEEVGGLFTVPAPRFQAEVLARDGSELAEIMELYWQHVASRDPSDSYQDYRTYADEQVRHEEEHERAARALGMLGIYLGITLLRDEGGDNLWPFNFAYEPSLPFTKLHYAATVVAPPRPSSGDLGLIHTLGYQGKPDVIQRLHARGLRLPL